MGCYQDSSSVQRIPGEFVHLALLIYGKKLQAFWLQ